jgi:hypothetical protein
VNRRKRTETPLISLLGARTAAEAARQRAEARVQEVEAAAAAAAVSFKDP